MRGSRKILVAVLSLVIVIGFVYILTPTPPSSSGYLPTFGGFFHVSEIQEARDNLSYSFMFHDVNFTFLYWCWSIPPVNGSPIPVEQTVYVYVHVSFSDNTSEILKIGVHSWGTCIIGANPNLRGVTTNHSHPISGVASAYTEEFLGSWVYVVSVW